VSSNVFVDKILADFKVRKSPGNHRNPTQPFTTNGDLEKPKVTPLDIL